MTPRILIVFGSAIARDRARYHQTFEGGNCIRRTLDIAEFPTFTVHFGLISQTYLGVWFDIIIEDESVNRNKGISDFYDKDVAVWKLRKQQLLIPKKDSSPRGG